MLKITDHTDSAGRRSLVLEGHVAGRWVTELRAACDALRAAGQPLTLDLRDVRFIDAAGLAFFGELGASATLINCSLFAAEQLKHVFARRDQVQA
jgi:anti-anti-sigma regulatory factor